MKTTDHTRMTSPVSPALTAGAGVDTYLVTWLEAFLTAKRAAGMAKNTILFYARKLRQFNAYCETQQLTQLEQVTPAFLRDYLLYLEQTGHNAGGRHAAYRAIRAFLIWY